MTRFNLSQQHPQFCSVTQRRTFLAGIVAGLVSLHGTNLNAQQNDVAEAAPSSASEPSRNSAAQEAVATGLQQITEPRVLSAVSFLSSDELAGRDTPSPELKIASSYVAARFRGAGLEPLGANETFYQSSRITAVQGPSAAAAVTLAGQPDPIELQVLLPPAESLELSAQAVAENDLFKADEPQLAIIEELRLPVRLGNNLGFVLTLLQRRTAAMSKLGVKAALMKVKSDSPLLELASRLKQEAVVPREPLTLACPVILLPETVELSDDAVRLNVPAARTVRHEVHNVVGVLRGSVAQQSGKAIVVSAHLDHIGTQQRGTDRVNNGADDNASGVTAVLSLADAFAALKEAPPVSIVFVTFWGEEQGMKGSRQFVEESPWPLSDIIANVNIEMVGRPEKDASNKAWMTGWKHSNLGPLLNEGAATAGVEIFHREDVSEMLYTRSDNVSFVRRGIIAHSVSAGSLHSDYHQPGDEWQKLDIPHMTRVIQGLFAGTLHLAHNHERLKKQ